jgi:hypothetical protein
MSHIRFDVSGLLSFFFLQRFPSRCVWDLRRAQQMPQVWGHFLLSYQTKFEFQENMEV